jgi:hypothetical protein
MHAYDHFNDRRRLRQRPSPSAEGLGHRPDPDIDQQGVKIKLAPLDVLFLEGAPAAFLCRVDWGELQLYRMLRDGKRQAIAKKYKGDYCICSMGSFYAMSCAAISRAEATRFPWSSSQQRSMQSRQAQRAPRAGVRSGVNDLSSRSIADCSLAGSLVILLDFANGCNRRNKPSEFTVSLEKLLDRLSGSAQGTPAEERSPN